MNDAAPGTPLDPFRSTAIYARSIVTDTAHKLLLRRSRSRAQVLSDYDQGEWAQQAAAENWLSCESVSDYNRKRWVNGMMTSLINGRLYRIPALQYYDFKTLTLGRTLREFALNTDELVEVGSGAGANLLILAEAGCWDRLVGLELSENGRQVTRKLVDRFRIENVEVGYIDLLDPQSEGFRRIAGKTVFTHYCLEQLPAHTEQVFSNLIAAGVRRVINIEPTPELFSPASLRDLATIAYIWRQDYQRTIVRTARKLAAAGEIDLIAVRRLNYAPTCRNDPTLVVWEPKSGK